MQDSNPKYDKLVKDNELLQQKLDNTIQELAKEKEINKSSNDASMKNDSQNCMKLIYIFT